MNPKYFIGLLAGVAAGWIGLHAQETTSEAPEPESLEPDSPVVELEEFEVTSLKTFSDQAIPGETPVAFTELTKETIGAELGSRDIPLVLNTTPSVYASTDSGGAGDARVNVRGFNQRNVSIMINGVPTNDIENGWLYWSNWDGVGDVTATIQMQRGLSNVTLPTPSIGGTMNIITDPAASEAGGSLKLEIGSDDFRKGTLVLNTGLLKEKVAFTFGLVAKEGEGYARGTWSNGYGYYFGSTLLINERNRIEMFALGSPQQHGQRTFASNIAAYDADYARSLGYSEEDLEGALTQGPVDSGYAFNPNYAPVSPSYTDKQYYYGSNHVREKPGFINERQNFFHKPQININWYSTLAEKTKLGTVFYYTGGRGGGAGTLYNTTNVYGFQSSSRAYGRNPNTDPLYGSAYDWDKTIEANAGTRTVRDDMDKNEGESLGILRNSVNNQDQFGIVSKLTHEFTDNLTVTGGVDWRTAEIAHYREVRDLLGGDYYLAAPGQESEFWPNGNDTQLGRGHKVDYHNTNTVDWLGLFVHGAYNDGPVHAFAVYGYSTTDYGFEDHFRRASEGSSSTYTLESNNLSGHQIKGGVTYAFTPQFSGFVNAGWVSKAPIFDGAIDDTTGTLLDPINEEFTSFEAGGRFETTDRKFNVSASLYSTRWRDRTITSVSERDNTITYQREVNSDYRGFELESAWLPLPWLRFDLAASIGDWTYVSDAPIEVYDITTGEEVPNAGRLYLKNLQVGDAPQSQIAYAVTFYPVNGLSIKLQGRSYSRYWSDYDPDTRQDESDRGQAWRIPSFSVFDVHASYTLPFNFFGDVRTSVFIHAFNILDETYVSDATDNSSYEGVPGAPSHSAQRAEAFLGAPLIVNGGLKFMF
jgi:outer membrane cobalamin receptor